MLSFHMQRTGSPSQENISMGWRCWFTELQACVAPWTDRNVGDKHTEDLCVNLKPRKASEMLFLIKKRI